VPLITAEDRPLARRTLKLLPPSTRVFPLETRTQASEAAIRLLVRVFKFVAALGRARSIDPGRPGVPPFGSKIYNLRAFPTKRLFRATCTDCKNQAIARKLTAGAIPQGLDDAVIGFIHQLEKQSFGAIVFDFDGTLCSSQDRMHGVSSPLLPHLINLVENDVLIGIATGRGKSARDALRSVIPKKHWERAILGYYNGSVLGALGDDGLPDNSTPGDQDLRHLAQKLLSLPGFDNMCAHEIRPYQITLSSKRGGSWRIIAENVRELMSIAPPGLRLLESSHTLDIVSASASKLNVVSRVRSILRQNLSILCIGDRGDLAGNDHELLSTAFSLSAHLVSPSSSHCWNLAPPGWRCAQATLFYLNCLKSRRGRCRFSLEEGLSWLKDNE
jgi:hypothetical protein